MEKKQSSVSGGLKRGFALENRSQKSRKRRRKIQGLSEKDPSGGERGFGLNTRSSRQSRPSTYLNLGGRRGARSHQHPSMLGVKGKGLKKKAGEGRSTLYHLTFC